MSLPPKPRGLGRGLSALLGDGGGNVLVAEKRGQAAAEAAWLGRQTHGVPASWVAASAAVRRRRMNSLASRM